MITCYYYTNKYVNKIRGKQFQVFFASIKFSNKS